MEVHLFTTIFFFLSTTVLLPSTTTGFPFPPFNGFSFPPSGDFAFPPSSDDTEYIRSSCNTTRYPDTCVTSLKNYSGNIYHDPGRLALVAIHVALSNATHMANYVANISRNSNKVNPIQSSAIHDCSSVFEDAVDEIKKSQKEMTQLGWTGESVRFQLSNVQTWMSAALTNEDTCIDGFDGVPDGVMKADVCGRVVGVKEVTSNALALVNSYADSISV